LTATLALCMDAVTFGKRLRQLRTAAGLTRTELGERSGVNFRTIEAWEQGRGEPLISAVPKLAKALGVQPGELLIEPTVDMPTPPRGRPPKIAPPPKSPPRPGRGRKG
jgi:transcriptional regulator with XRE-family HTH domain